MSSTEQPNDEIRRIAGLLSRMAELAEQSSLTGSLQQGVGQSVRQYNVSVQRLEQIGAVPAGFFAPLVAGATFDDVGVAAAQVAGYLGIPGEEGGSGTTYHGAKYMINNTNGSGAEGELEELRELTRMLRARLPEA